MRKKETHPWFKLLIKVKTADEHDVIWKNALLMIREKIFSGEPNWTARTVASCCMEVMSRQSTKSFKRSRTGAKDEILCPNFESRLEKQNYALNFRKTQLPNRNKFQGIHCQGRSPYTGCLVSSDTTLVWGFVFFFIKIEIKSKYLVMTEKVSTGDKGSEL